MLYIRLLQEISVCTYQVQANSARALVKKTQESGIKLQKADFFRNDTWTSPQTNSEDAPKIPLVHFFLIQDGRHHVTPFSKKRGIP